MVDAFSFYNLAREFGSQKECTREKIAQPARTMLQCVELAGKKGGLSTTTEANCTACGVGAHVQQHHAGIWPRSAQARTQGGRWSSARKNSETKKSPRSRTFDTRSQFRSCRPGNHRQRIHLRSRERAGRTRCASGDTHPIYRKIQEKLPARAGNYCSGRQTFDQESQGDGGL